MISPVPPVSLASARALCAALLCMGVSSVMAQTPSPRQATVSAAAPIPAPSPAAVTPSPTVVAPSLMVNNLFDKDRKVWPDRVPPPPPPAPPPAPAQVTDEDMQVYGVVITNQSKQATIKVGKRFAHLAPVGRSFANVTEGQSLGEFTLAAVRADHVVLYAPGGEQRLYFTRKTDRAAGFAGAVAAATPPVQGATTPTPDTAAAAQQPGTAMATGTAPSANGVAQQANPGDGGGQAAPAASPFNLRNSLATALEAARNNSPRQDAPPGNAPANPFQK